MATVVGSGMLLFTPVENWEKLPPGWEFIDVAGVAVDSKDNVYVFNRSEHPVIVFDRDGTFLRSWGEGLFSTRTHGIHIGPDDMVYCVDDGLHTVQKFSLDGKLLMTLGSPNNPAPNRHWHYGAVGQERGHAVADPAGNNHICRGAVTCAAYCWSSKRAGSSQTGAEAVEQVRRGLAKVFTETLTKFSRS